MPLQFDKQKNFIGGKSAEAIHWKYNFKVLNQNFRDSFLHNANKRHLCVELGEKWGGRGGCLGKGISPVAPSK